MVAGFSGTSKVQLTAELRGSGPGVVPLFTLAPLLDKTKTVPGSGAVGTGNLLYSGSEIIDGSGHEDLNLIGVLDSPFGDPLSFAELTQIFIKADIDNEGDLVIGAASSHPFNGPLGTAGTWTLRPGEFLFWESAKGWPVTAAVSDNLRISNSDEADAGCQVRIVGRSVGAA